ncbi:SDR family NAD(P)-dependent oxidoreductase [Chloroflexota bacterium]
MNDLGNKVAFVTGTARKKGIGRGLALRLARDGADLAVNDIVKSPEELDPWDREAGWRGLDSLVAEIRSLGRQAIALTGDVTNSQEVNAMVARVVKEFGKIDILVNNAALLTRDLGMRRIVEIDEETWKRGIDVNLTSLFLMSKAVARQMIKQEQGGKIINIASRQGKASTIGMATYCASKAGVISLTQTLALELGEYKINVNAVCPGPIVSWSTFGKPAYEAMQQGMSEDEAVAKAYANAALGPLKRLGKVEDVANVVAFLASSQSDYMTGQAVNISGGLVFMR